MNNNDLQTGFRLGDWSVFPLMGKVSDGQSEHHLEPKVMDVLVMLAETPGAVVLRDRIIERVWVGRPTSDDALSKCVTELRKVLGDDARHPTIIDTVPKRGYRLLTDVGLINAEPTPATMADSIPAVSSASRRTVMPLLMLSIVAALVVAALMLLPGLRESPDSGTAETLALPPTGKHTIAVLPFRNRSDDPRDAFIVDGLHDDLITQLARINDWRVISRTSVEQFRDATDSLRTIGAKLNANLIVEGGVQRNGDSVRINVQLVDARTDAHLWADTYSRELSVATLFDVQSEIVSSVAAELAAALEDDQSAGVDAPTENFQAYNQFVKGRSKVDTESVTSLNDAAEYFKTAIDLDTGYADAYAALADTYLSLGAYFFGGLSYPEAIALAEPLVIRAMELNPDLPGAYVAAGLMHLMRQDMDAAEVALQRAIALQPSYSRAYRIYAGLRWQQGRPDDAIEMAEFAESLDPESGPILFDLGRYFDAAGRYDDAMKRYVAAAELMPGNALARVYLAAMKYLGYGEVAESLVWYHEAAALDPESPSTQAVPAMAYLEIGDLERAGVFVAKGMALDADSFWPRFTHMCLNLRRDALEAAAEDARVLLDAYQRSPDALRVLRDRDLATGKIQSALVRYAKAYPELSETAEPTVNDDNLFAAVDYARLLIEHGEVERANDLLSQVPEVTSGRQRLGTYGFWLADVSALAMQGKRTEAIERLQTAIDEGYRIKLWYHLYMDPNLDSLGDDPEFLALRDRAGQLIQEQFEEYRTLDATLRLSEGG